MNGHAFLERMYLRPRTMTKGGGLYLKRRRAISSLIREPDCSCDQQPLVRERDRIGRTSKLFGNYTIEDFELYRLCHFGRRFDMKTIACIALCLGLAFLADATRTEQSQNKIQEQLLDMLTTDEMLKIKRPFCNAFTGCGRKRSFPGNLPAQEFELDGTVRLPVSVYKALLRAASQNMRIDRETNEYQLSDVPQVYLAGRTPVRKRLADPLASSD
ncbi:uncharacterized protein LOC117219549 [Megalopta genalis]|uniref:uncharacterized protein LOC117219549 n=1 Tax=Megalopta genalis TaxID=115081 RepID=UPI003FD077BC